MKRNLNELVTGRKAKPENENMTELGLFHNLSEELQNSLLSLCKKQAASARKNFARDLKRQNEVQKAKKDVAKQLKLDAAKNDHLTAIYFFQQ